MANLSDEESAQLDSALEDWGNRLSMKESARRKGEAIGEVRETRTEDGRRTCRLQLTVAFGSLAVLFFVGGATWGVLKVHQLLEEAAQFRRQLDAMHKVVGLDRSFVADFEVEQRKTVRVDVRIDPALVRLAEVSYDAGGSWKKLYDAGKQAAVEPVVRLEDKHAFAPPAAGKAEVTAKVRVQYIPAVLEAFPEYASADKTERSAEYEISAVGIEKVGEGPSPRLSLSVTPVDLAASRWELSNSGNATVVTESDPKDRVLVAKMILKDVGEWTTLSRSIPGATPANPFVSLKDVTHIEIQLVWDNPAQVALETKLVDDFGKIMGTVRFLAPGKASQTVRLPVGAMKPYFGVPRVDLSRIRRIELTFARKIPNQAAEGTVRIKGVSLVGTKPLPPTWKPPFTYATLASLSLRPDSWKTAKSTRAQIALAAQGDSLACKVNLPCSARRNKELPWTSLWTQSPDKSFPGLQAIELELRWDGEAPITIEPKLSTGSQGDTYGMQVRVQPARDLQKILIHPQDLKYYWAFAGETAAKGMDLDNLVSFRLGIARKAVDQAERGTLSIRSVRFLGTD